MKMLYQRGLQLPVIRLHRFCSATPRRDRALRQRLFGMGDHQFRIADQLRPESVTNRAGAEMAVEGEMPRREFS